MKLFCSTLNILKNTFLIWHLNFFSEGLSSCHHKTFYRFFNKTTMLHCAMNFEQPRNPLQQIEETSGCLFLEVHKEWRRGKGSNKVNTTTISPYMCFGSSLNYYFLLIHTTNIIRGATILEVYHRKQHNTSSPSTKKT